MGETNPEGGRPEEYPLDDVLATFGVNSDPCEPLSAGEVAERLDCGRRTALNKLDALVEEEQLRTKKVGARGRVFWRPGGNDGE